MSNVALENLIRDLELKISELTFELDNLKNIREFNEKKFKEAFGEWGSRGNDDGKKRLDEISLGHWLSRLNQGSVDEERIELDLKFAKAQLKMKKEIFIRVSSPWNPHANVDRRQPGEKVLECSLCMFEYDKEGVRRPKVLGCGHTFCGDCINMQLQQSLAICPKCRAPIPREIEKIPFNFELANFLTS